ncbi:2-succinyl-5-enolpyruvyl-6-hydroxy-3-cyclohexene-1-carboxylic-acid synthase [Ornithinimicrobium cryptoxanthini]|uniref:2-succinyl-5-enolpyruvyl-6-hydroxy-3-cyclohexene-1-carboxylate synthase n=1 Tax=Ornithinimicrobium cryptoxanthini TaxID=2934161 RepID=A0ABY4YJF5_9MICO|nr:2-succinyl-5-enolpyruvyl-6-hydroxy-3-cyclohexene-1-carboxylic-acid synthase [Ornithinimicrobium cryptoxanthini]USQ76927.1 2-succinyl-5-enolpyruvyl-6-hydroxy-3-cyclohexene-1-carboxylic-acid synthase [Ornithinimicrobium cryptoxanthini]
MNGSTALAAVLVDELVRCGVREVVLAPGSRSAPLAYAVQAAERAGRLRLHVRVDERSAGFLALGLAKISRRPAVVITTSGTAVANLHPAVLEAHHASVPLIVLSADRPDELRGTGANQTTVQPGIFAGAVRWEHDLTHSWGGSECAGPILGVVRAAHPAWRTTVDRAWAAATGVLGQEPGPVHLNVAFRDPLAPQLPVPSDLPEDLVGRLNGASWTVLPTPPSGPNDLAASPGQDAAASSGADGAHRVAGPATLMVLGDLPDPVLAEQALAVAVAQAWPVVAEPFGAGDRSTVLPHGSLVLTASDWLDAHAPERVLVVGRCTLNRETGALLRRPGIRVEAVTPNGTWPDPSHSVEQVHGWSALDADTDGLVGQDPAWAQAWRDAAHRMDAAVAAVLSDSWPSGPAVAQALLGALTEDDLLVLGSSNAARDIDRAGVAGRSLMVTGSRGLAGIDGTNATAVGIALASPGRPVTALVGDLTFLHDINGLLIGPDEPRPDLTIVVVNDDGGGIFSTLEYGEPDRADDFERVFGTPTGADLRALASAYSVGFERIETPGDLHEALATRPSGIRVLEVVVPRAEHRDLRETLTRTVAESLAELD